MLNTLSSVRYHFAISFLMFYAIQISFSQSVPSFSLQPNDLELTRLAQPSTYFDKVGKQFAVLGYESGSFEAWAYPLKLYRNVELSFFIGSSTEAIRAKDIVRIISVTPEATTLTYTYQSFTVKTIFITPINEPGGFILLDVNSTEPLTIVCSFLPALQPMWPAGIGGQSARWLDDIKAYQISEPTRKNNAYIGSPAASGISYTPAHMLSDVPNQFKIVVDKPESVRGRYIPIVMAGGKGSRDSIKAIYTRLASNPELLYRSNVEYYRSLRSSTLRLQTPNSKLNLAFEWAKVAYDNLFVDNPDLGFGMVAGLGPSGTGGRPGFGWFFSGDVAINSFSMLSYGAHSSVRDALTFCQKWQREDGKMAHELSQGAGYINWFKDYPYGYIHGDTSPFYICAMFDYYKNSGDTEFIKRSWASLKKAYDWSIATDEDGDGLMDNKKAGLGALEYGPLTDIQSDVYVAGVWVRASYGMQFLAEAAGEVSFAKKAKSYYEKGAKTFEAKFWDDKNQQYAYAITPKGEHVEIVSPWSSVALHWELGTPEHSLKSLEKLNSAELSTDWGTRSISIKSPYFEPLNYNYGAVWPFITSWVATAQFKNHLAIQGYNNLLASVNHTFDNGLGTVTEVFSGYQNIWPQEAVAHQGFCTAGVVLPLVRGLLGLESDAQRKLLTFAPHFPADWDSVVVENYKLGDGSVDISYNRTTSRITATLSTKNVKSVKFKFAPALGIGSTVNEVRVDGVKTSFVSRTSSQTIQPEIETALGGTVYIEIDFTPTVEILPPLLLAKTGDANKGLKVISTEYRDGALAVVLEGLSGIIYELGVVNEGLLKNVQSCTLSGKNLLIQFPAGQTGNFVRKEIVLRQK